MADALRIGIIGAGNFTRQRLLPNLLSIPGVEVVAVANRSLASAARVATEFNIPTALGDWQEVLARADVDAVLVGTPPYGPFSCDSGTKPISRRSFSPSATVSTLRSRTRRRISCNQTKTGGNAP